MARQEERKTSEETWSEAIDLSGGAVQVDVKCFCGRGKSAALGVIGRGY